MGNGILTDRSDNVATVISDITKGEIISIKTELGAKEIEAREAVPYGHKVALIHIAKGGEVVKYGIVIGYATRDIEQGEWVHTHNTAEAYVASVAT